MDKRKKQIAQLFIILSKVMDAQESGKNPPDSIPPPDLRYELEVLIDKLYVGEISDEEYRRLTYLIHTNADAYAWFIISYMVENFIKLDREIQLYLDNLLEETGLIEGRENLRLKYKEYSDYLTKFREKYF